MNNAQLKQIGYATSGGCLLLVILYIQLLGDNALNGQLNEAAAWSIFFIVMGTVLLAKKITLPKWLNGCGILLSFVLMPCLLVYLVEVLAGGDAASLGHGAYWFNVLVCQLVILLLFALTCHYRLALVGGSLFLYVFGLVNHFVLAFRGNPFLPADILAVGTAADVAGNYSIVLDQAILFTATMLFFALALCSDFHYSLIRRNWYQRGSRLVLLLCLCIVGNYLYQPNNWHQYKVSVNFWNQLQGYGENGALLSFVMNTRYLFPEMPEGYSAEKAAQMLSLVEMNTMTVRNQMVLAKEEQEKPNIIMIMNESYADLGVLGEFETTLPYLENLQALSENTTKGNLYVSVLGGGTCNTEFEVLTGNTMAFFPSGVMPYQQYVHDMQYSLATTLKAQGYQAVAFHPGKPDSWCRDTVYPLLGFDLFLTEEDMEQREYMRGAYVSDYSDYQEVIRLYENKGEEKLFLFNVTIQNHGGYQLDTADIPQWVSIVGREHYPQAEQYLSLMRASDQALAELLQYFSAEEEPTMIVFFGDHQPILEAEFVEQLLENKLGNLSREEMQQRYTVPFFIWTNYESPTEEIEAISSNYLSTLVLSKAGLALPLYNQFLQQLFDKLPVINSIGYVDQYGGHHSYTETGQWSDELNRYEMLQYNNFFDLQHRLAQIYTITKEED